MLADELIASPNLKMLGSGYDLLVKEVRASHRFVLDERFALAADDLSRLNPSSLEKMQPFVRLPYPKCWFETAHQYRPSFAVEGKERENSRKDVARVGILASGDTTHLTLHLAWSFRTGEVCLSPWSLIGDIGGGQDATEIRRSYGVTVDHDFLSSRYRGFDLDAAIQREARVFPIPSLFWADILQRSDQNGRPPQFISWMRSVLDDWNSEGCFWEAVLGLLNSRNVAAIEEADLSKVNRRRRLTNKKPLLSHSVCRIAQRLIKRVGGDSEDGPARMRAHFVRGHPKIRKTGIFWWSPFIRGDHRLGFVSKDYTVEG